MAVTRDAVGILFGVKGGVDGESAKLIQSQLEEIAKSIELKININEKHFSTQIEKLKAKLTKELSGIKITPGVAGGSSDAVKEEKLRIEELRRALEKYVNLQAKLYKLTPASDQNKDSSFSRQYLEINQQLKEAEEAYKQLNDEVIKHQDFTGKIKDDYEAYSKALLNSANDLEQAADKMSQNKIQSKANSLYTDNGFDKVIARSEEAKKLVDDFNAKVRTTLAGGATNGQIKELNEEFVNVQGQLKRIERETDTVGNEFKEAFGQHVIQHLASILLMTGLRALRQVYDNVVKLNTAMTQFKIVTKQSGDVYEKFADQIAASAKKIGSDITSLINSATTFARLGYSVEEAASLAEKATAYSKVAAVEIGEATSNLTAIIKAFNVSASDLESVLDQMIYVGNNYAISSAEIGAAMNNASSALAANGNTLQQAIGIVTAANVTLQNVSRSSTAVRTIAARISASTAELEELGDDAGSVLSTSDLDKRMRAYGIAITDANGNLRSTYDILSDLSKKWDALSNTQRAAIADMVAGTRQQNAFFSIMQNWADAEKIVKDAGEAAGSYTDAVDTYMDSIEGKMNALTAAWQEFSDNILGSEIVKFFITIISGIVNVLDWFTSLGNGAVRSVGVTVAALVLLTTAFTLFKTKITAIIAAIKTSLKSLIKENLPFVIISGIIALMNAFEGKAQGFAEVIVGAVAFIALGITIALKGLDATIKAFMASNFIGWILAAITALVAVVKGVIDIIKSFNPSYEDLKNAAKEAKDAWHKANEEIEKTKDLLEEVESRIKEIENLDAPTLADEIESRKLKEQVALLREQLNVQKEIASQKQKEAALAVKEAVNKLNKQNSDQLLSDSKTALGNYIEEMQELLSDYDYYMGDNLEQWQKDINNSFDNLYKWLDIYTIKFGNAADAIQSIWLRTKYQPAIDALSTLAKSGEVSADSLQRLYDTNDSVKEFINYLIQIGAFSWEDQSAISGLVNQVNSLAKSTATIIELSWSDNLDLIKDKFETIKTALEEIKNDAFLSADSIKTLFENYKSLMEYFNFDDYTNKGFQGVTLKEEYKSWTMSEIYRDVAAKELQEFVNTVYDMEAAVEKAKLSGNIEEIENAENNLSIAQRNLSLETAKWMSYIRAEEISEITEALNERKDALSDQVDQYKELIDARKELLETYKSEIEYQRELAKKTKNLTDLQTQLALAQLDKSAAGKARTRELLQKVNDAKEELDEFTLDRAVDVLTNSLDNQYQDYKKFIDDEIKQIEDFIANLFKEYVSEGIATPEPTNDKVEGYQKQAEQDVQNWKIRTNRNDTNTNGIGEALTKVKNAKTNEDARSAYEGLQEVIANNQEKNTYSYVESVTAKKENYNPFEKFSTNIDAGYYHYTPEEYERDTITTDDGETYLRYYSGYTKSYYWLKAGEDYDVETDKNGNKVVDVHSFRVGYSVEKNGSYIPKYEEYENHSPWSSYEDAANAGHPEIRTEKEFARGGKDKELYETYQRYLDAMYLKLVGTYHSGGFVGGLKSNETFAKLLNGEYVSTPQQMQKFIEHTLPMIAQGGENGAKFEYHSPLITIQCDNITEEALPKLKDIVDAAVKQVGKEIESALSRTGHKKKY